MKSFEQLKEKSDALFAACRDMVISKPWAVTVAMHEYYRNLYPSDPYLPLPKDICPTERLYTVTSNLLQFLDSTHLLGSYPMSFGDMAQAADVKDRTGSVYGPLWSKLSFEELTRKATAMLRERLEANGFDPSSLKGTHALDVGCGSGRFSFALKQFGCETVLGVDYGDEGLQVGRDLVARTGVRGLSFQKASVLQLPFPDNSFDFVFCNGVLHHTENMEKGLAEMVRVAKPGARIWLYLYADGGIFWYARKEMPKIMKQIPQHYAMAVLDMIGMPSNRFIFADNWYVPIERHTSDQEARSLLADLGIRKIHRVLGGPIDLAEWSVKGGEVGRIMVGDGELRYLLEK